MSFGERIAELRMAAGLSQMDLAKLLNVSRQAVSKWENDTAYPDVSNLLQLADILDTDIEYLATGRRTYGRRPPVVLKSVETVEKIVEKPVVQTVETVVERIVEVPVIQTVEKPVLRKVYRTVYVRKPLEFFLVACICFLIGFLVGMLF